jgi:hypothetical protein
VRAFGFRSGLTIKRFELLLDAGEIMKRAVQSLGIVWIAMPEE